MEYLLKASVLIAIFYICYKMFLQGETFFQSNRWFLFTGLLTAFTVPMIVIPIYISQTPIEIPNIAFTEATSIEATKTTDYFQIAYMLYIVGFGFFAIRFLIQLASLIKLFFHTEKQKQEHFVHLKTTSATSPFSFFKWIVYNPSQFEENELSQILTHEKVHAKQHHSLDIMLSHLATIVFWFNPFVWLYRKEIQQNLEFIADNNTQNQLACKKSYQYLLLKVSVPNHQLALTNNFYNSLIKKRIVMLHKSKSKKTNQLKFLIIVPIMGLFLMSFNTKRIIIENKETIPLITELKTSVLTDTQIVVITEDYTDADFEKTKVLMEKNGITPKFKNIKRNSVQKITGIKIELKSKESNANFNINGDEPIKAIKISYDDKGNNISISSLDGVNLITTDDDADYAYTVSGNGTNEIHFSNDDNQKVNVNIMRAGNVGKTHTIVSNNDEGTHIYATSSAKSNNDSGITIISKDKDGSVLSVGKGQNYRVATIGKVDDKANIITTVSGDKPLSILNGKEISEEEMNELDPDTIEKVEILKGDKATSAYGEKGKDGVIIITTK